MSSFCITHHIGHGVIFSYYTLLEFQMYINQSHKKYSPEEELELFF